MSSEYRGRLPWDDSEIVRSWLYSGKSRKQIKILADLNACSTVRIEAIIRAAGYKSKKSHRGKSMSNPWTQDHEAMLVDMRAQGYRWQEVANHIGHSVRSCIAHAYENELFDAISARRRENEVLCNE